MPRQVEIQNQMLAVRKADELSEKARADQADLNFGYTQIYAPADGIIGDKQAEVGMQVQPGQELCALTELNDVWVTANFKVTGLRWLYRSAARRERRRIQPSAAGECYRKLREGSSTPARAYSLPQRAERR
jgi:hypothetical protein